MRLSSTLARALWPALGSFVSGALALLALVLVARYRGPAEYASFAVLWGCFFGIGGCLSGYQQELTRSLVHGPDRANAGGPRVRLTTASILVAVPLAVMAGVFSSGESEVGGSALSTGLVIAFGVLSLSMMVQINGVLVAHDRWGVTAGVLAADAVLRTTAIWVVVSLADGRGLAFAVVLGALVWIPLAGFSSVRQALMTEMPATLGAFAPRAIAAMVSAGCAALIVAGFPLLLALFRADDLDRSDGVLLAALTLIRSPVLLVAYAYRPVVLKLLLESRNWARTLLRLWSWCLAAGGGLVLLLSGIGPWGVRIIAGEEFGLTRVDAALITTGAVLLVMLIVSGVTLVTLGAHAWSTQGWLVALLVTCAVLVLAPSARADVLAAGLLGPGAGLAWHGAGLARLHLVSDTDQSKPSENADSRSCRE